MRCCRSSPCSASSYRGCSPARSSPKRCLTGRAGHIHIDSLAARDYPVLMGFTLFLAVLTILGNLIADVLYAWADPRIRVRS
jgi:hypothetical protein